MGNKVYILHIRNLEFIIFEKYFQCTFFRSRRELLNENDIAALDETVNTEVASGRFNSSQVMLEDEDDNPEEFLIEDFSD